MLKRLSLLAAKPTLWNREALSAAAAAAAGAAFGSQLPPAGLSMASLNGTAAAAEPDAKKPRTAYAHTREVGGLAGGSCKQCTHACMQLHARGRQTHPRPPPFLLELRWAHARMPVRAPMQQRTHTQTLQWGDQATGFTHACLQSFMSVYDKLREALLEDKVLGEQPVHAKEWLKEVGVQQEECEPPGTHACCIDARGGQARQQQLRPCTYLG